MAPRPPMATSPKALRVVMAGPAEGRVGVPARSQAECLAPAISLGVAWPRLAIGITGTRRFGAARC
jgi:hypothetical protein